MTKDVFTEKGWVRAVVHGETDKAGPYARIRLARDPGYLFDFDNPDAWHEDMRDTYVTIWFTEQAGADGFTYRVILDMEFDE